MSIIYYRPLLQTDATRPDGAVTLAGGWCWFNHVECLQRRAASTIVPVDQLPPEVLERMTTPRAMMLGLDWSVPRLMGIINTTPDSFSDGGAHHAKQDAVAQGTAMSAAGADILDIGGESTRPGADYIEVAQEIARTAPVIAELTGLGIGPVSIDTRKADVGIAALKAGAGMINDVAAFTHDPALAQVAATAGAPVCLMHAQGQPKDMQAAPTYENVLLDVYDFLEDRIAVAIKAGIKRDQIIVDPGIGFGKTIQHNLALLRGLALFHTLGCPVLLGASRKRFIGTIGNAADARDRTAGTLAVTLQGIAQGVQLHRVHDIKPAKQALDLHGAVVRGWSADG